MRKWILFFIFISLFIYVNKTQAQFAPPIEFTEEDGSPSTFPYQVKFSNGTVTDNGDGTTSITNSGGSSEWTDAGTVLYPNETTDDVSLGATTAAGGGKLAITGDDDQIQLYIKQNATQEASNTDTVFIVDSSDTELFRIEDDGDVCIGCATVVDATSELTIFQSSASNGINIRGALTPANESAEIYMESTGDSLIIDGDQFVNIVGDNTTSMLRIFESGIPISYANFSVEDTTVDFLNIRINTGEGTPGLTIDDDDQVGIGTNTPSEALEVVGSIAIQDSGGITSTCLSSDASDRLFHDTNCDEVKDGGEEYIDQAGGGSGDAITVNSSAVDTTANFLNGDIDFTLVDGGAGGPDDITATVGCTDCVTLTTETVGNYAAGDAEAGNATGVACTDCVALTTETSGNYVANVSTSVLTGLTGGSAGSEGASLSLDLDYSQTLAGNPALGSLVTVMGTNGILFEGTTANTIEGLLRWPTITTTDKTITLPDATGTVTLLSVAQTLTNKTIALGSNTVSGTKAQFDTAVTDGNIIYTDGSSAFTAEQTIDDLGLEFTPGDALTDCTTFSATGGGIFYDDSEGKFKKCQDNTLTDLDTGGSETNDLESIATSANDGEIFVGTGVNTGAYITGLAACAADEKIEYVPGVPDTFTCEAIGSIDISADTNLAVTSPVVLTDDTLSLNQNAGTDITADLEEESHCSEHDGRSTTCSSEVLNADEETYWFEISKTIEQPIDADDLIVHRFDKASTVTTIECIVENATSAVLVVIECDGNGDNCGSANSRLEESITCAVTMTSDDGTIGNPGIAAGGTLRLQVGTVTSTVGHLMVTIAGTRDD